jgi:P-type Cu+ transporter
MDETNTVVAGKPLQPKIETRDIAIEGMTCDNCVRTVEKALRGLKGVREVRVDRAKARATVSFDTVQTDIPAIHDCLLKAGYKPTATASEK